MKKEETKKPGLKKNFLLSTAYQILLILAPTITAPYVARVLEADGTGAYSYTYSYVTYFILFAALGTAAYGAREIARNRNDKKNYSQIFWEIEILTIITTCICLFFWGIWIAFSDKYKIYYLIHTLFLLAVIFDISWFYTGLEQFQNIVFINAFFKIISVISIFVFVNQKTDIYIYILILGASVLLGNISMWLGLKKYIVKVDKKLFKIKRHFKETLIYFIPTIAISIYTVLDKTLIGLIAKSEYENGYYEQATKIINMAKSLTFAAINSVMGARISYLFVEKKYEEIKGRITKSIDYILFMGFGIMFGLIAISKRFVPLFFGEGYDNVVWLLRIMSPVILIIGISNCLGFQYYTPAGLRKESAKYIIAGSLVNLVFNLFFIPLWRGYGAAYATIIAEGTISFLYLKHCNGFLKLSYIIKQSVKKIISGIVMLFAVLFIDKTISIDLMAILVEILAGAGVYFVLLFILKDKAVREYLPLIFKRN